MAPFGVCLSDFGLWACFGCAFRFELGFVSWRLSCGCVLVGLVVLMLWFGGVCVGWVWIVVFVRWGVAFVGVVGCDLFVLCLLWVLILFAWVGFPCLPCFTLLV